MLTLPLIAADAVNAATERNPGPEGQHPAETEQVAHDLLSDAWPHLYAAALRHVAGLLEGSDLASHRALLRRLADEALTYPGQDKARPAVQKGGFWAQRVSPGDIASF